MLAPSPLPLQSTTRVDEEQNSSFSSILHRHCLLESDVPYTNTIIASHTVGGQRPFHPKANGIQTSGQEQQKKKWKGWRRNWSKKQHRLNKWSNDVRSIYFSNSWRWGKWFSEAVPRTCNTPSTPLFLFVWNAWRTNYGTHAGEPIRWVFQIKQVSHCRISAMQAPTFTIWFQCELWLLLSTNIWCFPIVIFFQTPNNWIDSSKF